MSEQQNQGAAPPIQEGMQGEMPVPAVEQGQDQGKTTDPPAGQGQEQVNKTTDTITESEDTSDLDDEESDDLNDDEEGLDYDKEEERFFAEGGEGEDEDFDEEQEIVRAKWLMDGCETLDAAMHAVSRFIVYLKGLQEAGYEFSRPVQDDYGFLTQKKKQPAAQATKKE